MKSIRKSWMPALVLLLALVMLILTAQVASASHVRPRGATPLYHSLVLAYKPCTSPDTTHGGPFPPASSNGSCKQPVLESGFLEVGSPDVNGARVNMVARVRLDVLANPPRDVRIDTAVTDVRCGSTPSSCGAANTAAGPDYTGDLDEFIPMRITDHYNDDGAQNFTATATAEDLGPGNPDDPTLLGFEIRVSCAQTAGTEVGSTCASSTTMNALLPGSVRTGDRANIEIPGPIKLFDGGADGSVATSPNTLFLESGYFVP
jgi:hypothetical protein